MYDMFIEEARQEGTPSHVLFQHGRLLYTETTTPICAAKCNN